MTDIKKKIEDAEAYFRELEVSLPIFTSHFLDNVEGIDQSVDLKKFNGKESEFSGIKKLAEKVTKLPKPNEPKDDANEETKQKYEEAKKEYEKKYQEEFQKNYEEINKYYQEHFSDYLFMTNKLLHIYSELHFLKESANEEESKIINNLIVKSSNTEQFLRLLNFSNNIYRSVDKIATDFNVKTSHLSFNNYFQLLYNFEKRIENFKTKEEETSTNSIEKFVENALQDQAYKIRKHFSDNSSLILKNFSNSVKDFEDNYSNFGKDFRSGYSNNNDKLLSLHSFLYNFAKLFYKEQSGTTPTQIEQIKLMQELDKKIRAIADSLEIDASNCYKLPNFSLKFSSTPTLSESIVETPKFKEDPLELEVAAKAKLEKQKADDEIKRLKQEKEKQEKIEKEKQEKLEQERIEQEKNKQKELKEQNEANNLKKENIIVPKLNFSTPLTSINIPRAKRSVDREISLIPLTSLSRTKTKGRSARINLHYVAKYNKDKSARLRLIKKRIAERKISSARNAIYTTKNIYVIKPEAGSVKLQSPRKNIKTADTARRKKNTIKYTTDQWLRIRGNNDKLF